MSDTVLKGNTIVIPPEPEYSDDFQVEVSYTIGKTTAANLLRWDMNVGAFRTVARFDDLELANRVRHLLTLDKRDD